MRNVIRIVLLLAAMPLACPAQAGKSTAPKLTPQQEELVRAQIDAVTAKTERDQVAAQSLEKTLTGLTEFNQWLQLQREIAQLQQQNVELKKQIPPAAPPAAGKK